MIANTHDIAFLGFGEAAQAFLSGLRLQNPELTAAAFDIKTQQAATAPEKLATYDRENITGLTHPEQVSCANIIFSTVTADQAGIAAKSAALGSLESTVFLDCNSCAPETKKASSQVIEAAGGHYIDMAVMAPVHPKLHKTPCRISGPDAAMALDTLTGLGMDISIADGPVGTASMQKMLRSVMIKGMEALALECLLSARKAGVENSVIESLNASFPGFDWASKGAYMLERTTTHGLRRAAEMREVALTVDSLGLPSPMSKAIVDWQQRMGELGLSPDEADLPQRADRILTALKSTNTNNAN